MNLHLTIGYISRAHGTDGDIVIRTFDPSSQVIDEVDRLFVKMKDGTERELDIEDVRIVTNDLLVTFKGVRGRDASKALVGSTVMVFREDIEAPEDGSFFQGDLVGLEAFTPEGKRLGVIEEVWSTGPVPNLVIRDGATELMVPFADEFVPKVDLEAKRVTIIPPEFIE